MTFAAGTPPTPRKDHIPGEAGIWFFVGGDLLVFTLFFVLVALGQAENPIQFATSRAHLDKWLGLANTLLLLTSSWLVALAVTRCRQGNGRSAAPLLAFAVICGLAFITNKAFEWHHKISAGITPETNDFFMYYFVFTGIHLFHVIIGLVVMAIICRSIRRPALSAIHMSMIESGAIFWHLVDLLWVILFALFYLL